MHAVLLLLASCAPVFDDETPYVDAPRVLAVKMEPAEALEGEEVDFEALYADASGPLADPPLDWSFCTVPKPLAELGPVSGSCLDPGSEDLAPIGTGADTAGLVPDDACSLFGPNPPPPQEGELGDRPADPDVTGGYYQPAIGLLEGGNTTLAAVRVRCGLAYVTQETYIAWNQGYHDNENPSVQTLMLSQASGATPLVPDTREATPSTTVPAGETVTLSAIWPVCPVDPVCGDAVCSAGEDLESCAEDCTTPVGCDGAETYVVYQAETGALETRREAVSATWFATGGTLEEARNGRDGEDLENVAANTWTAPTTRGEVWLSVVLRDERGGVDFAGYRLTITE